MQAQIRIDPAKSAVGFPSVSALSPLSGETPIVLMNFQPDVLLKVKAWNGHALADHQSVGGSR